jgi:hypothetical protein
VDEENSLEEPSRGIFLRAVKFFYEKKTGKKTPGWSPAVPTF